MVISGSKLFWLFFNLTATNRIVNVSNVPLDYVSAFIKFNCLKLCYYIVNLLALDYNKSAEWREETGSFFLLFLQ